MYIEYMFAANNHLSVPRGTNTFQVHHISDPKFQRRKRVRRFRNNTISLVGYFTISLIILWLFYFFVSSFAHRSVNKDIDRLLKSLDISRGDGEESLRSHAAPHGRVLLVGLIESIRELNDNKLVVDSISSLCFVYQRNSKGNFSSSQEATHEGFVELNVLYESEGTDNPNSIIGPLSEKLHLAGCKTRFIRDDHVLTQSDLDHFEGFETGKQTHLSRYRRLARLRSAQRRHILDEHSSGDFDVVINVDLDIVQFPPLHAMLQAIQRSSLAAKTGNGSIVCANGHETWTMWAFQRHLYYDTFASIDANGEWYYTKYAASLWQIITFGQVNLFRNILKQHPDLWPMQTCFGGLAIYDYPSWISDDCDYDEQKIDLRASIGTSTIAQGMRGLPVFEKQMRQFHDDLERLSHWKVPSRYTIDNSPNGDVCEHVVFQQCLLASAIARRAPLPTVGIQPNLLIGRTAAILSKREDKVNLVKKVLFILFSLNILSMFVNYFRERLQQRFGAAMSWRLNRPKSNSHFHKA